MSRHVDDGVATVNAGTTHRGGSDMRAAFMGLIFGTLVLLALVFTVVKLTARSFEGHAAAPAAGGEQHAPPAASAPATGAPAAGTQPPAAPAPGAPPAGAPTTGTPPAPPTTPPPLH
jgi:hypothetical protein